MFIGKVRIITQSIFSRKVWFQFLISQRIFSKTYFQHKGYRQSSVRFSIITQKFQVTISINFFRKKQERSFRRKFGKYVAHNVLWLALSGVEPKPSHYKYNKTFHSAADFPQENPEVAIEANRCQQQFLFLLVQIINQ